MPTGGTRTGGSACAACADRRCRLPEAAQPGGRELGASGQASWRAPEAGPLGCPRWRKPGRSRPTSSSTPSSTPVAGPWAPWGRTDPSRRTGSSCCTGASPTERSAVLDTSGGPWSRSCPDCSPSTSPSPSSSWRCRPSRRTSIRTSRSSPGRRRVRSSPSAWRRPSSARRGISSAIAGSTNSGCSGPWSARSSRPPRPTSGCCSSPGPSTACRARRPVRRPWRSSWNCSPARIVSRLWAGGRSSVPEAPSWG